MKRLNHYVMFAFVMAIAACGNGKDAKMKPGTGQFCGRDVDCSKAEDKVGAVYVSIQLDKANMNLDPLDEAFGPYIKTAESFEASSLGLSPVLGAPRYALLAGSLISESCWPYDATDGTVAAVKCIKDYSASIDPVTGILYATFSNKAVGFEYTLTVMQNDQFRLDNVSAIVVGNPPATQLKSVCVYPRWAGVVSNVRGMYLVLSVQRNNAGTPSIRNYPGNDSGACGYVLYRMEFDYANATTNPVVALTTVRRTFSWSATPAPAPPTVVTSITVAVSAMTTATSKFDILYSVPASTATTNSNVAGYVRAEMFVNNPPPNGSWNALRNVTAKLFNITTNQYICKKTLTHLVNQGTVAAPWYVYQWLGIVPLNPAVCVLESSVPQTNTRDATIGAP